MSSCSIALSNTKKLFEADKKRAELLMQTMQVTKEGEVLAQTVDTANRAIELLNNKELDKLPLVDRKGLVNSVPAVTVRSYLKDVFQGAIGRSANSKSPRQDLVLQSAERIDGNLHIKVTPKGKEKYWTYVFEPYSNVSKNTDLGGNRLYISGFSHIFSSVENAVQDANSVLTRKEHAKIANETTKAIMEDLEKSKDINSLLGSTRDASKVFNYKRANKRPHYVHGSKAHMKGLLEDLHALTDNSIDSSTFEYYSGLLDNMHEHFFRDMNVYINENANHTHGWVDLNKKHILLNVSSNWFEGMSNEEVYIHELIHTMTAWAINQEGFKASRLQARLNRLRKIAEKVLTWQQIAKDNPQLTEKEAKERFNYIFDSNRADDEFLAFALTNPAIMDRLEKVKVKGEKHPGLLNAIVDFFADLMDVVMGNYTFQAGNGNLKEEIHALAFKLAEINAKADGEVDNGGLFYQVGQFVDRIESRFEEAITAATDKLDKTSPVAFPENPTKLDKVMLTIGFFTKGIYNSNYRHAVGTYFTNLKVAPTSSVREVFRNFLPKLDDSYYETEKEGLKATSIDSIRNLHNTAATRSIVKGFTRPLKEAEEVALTSVFLESNGSVLFRRNKNMGKGYTTQQIANLISDTGMRKRTIGRLEARIKKKAGKRGNWVVGQANGLGKLMATGKGHEAQVSNSISIVRGYGTSERFHTDNQLLHMVEELVALRALDYQNVTELAGAAHLLLKEEKGVRNIVNLYNNFKKDSVAELFTDDPSHMLEGYTKELFDDTIEVRHEPLADKELMEKQGFKLVSEIKHHDFAGGIALGVYVSKSFAQAERLRGAVSLGGPQSRGVSLKDIRFKQYGDNKKHAQVYFEADKIALNKKAIEINKKLEEGTSFDAIEEGSVPILDATGNVVDYRQMMDKRLKAKFLNQDKAVSRVLARTSGSVIDKVARATHNEEVLKIIKKNVREVYDAPNSKNNLEDYTLINADHTDPDIRRLFHMLPKTYRDFANRREDKSLPIPSVLMHQYFGYSHYRFADIPGINHLPAAIKHILNIYEAYWLDLVKIAKGNVLLKMPVVLVTNIVSNILYAISTGTDPRDIVGHYRDSFRDVKDFMAAHKESQELRIELASVSQNVLNVKFTTAELEEYNEKVQLLERRIARLEKEMNKNEVKELFDIGMYQSVIEDIEMYKLGDTNRISDGMDQLLNKMPAIVKTPLQIAYLSKETAWYKINQEVLQLSDLVARDVMNRKQKQIEKEQAEGKRDLPVEYRKLIDRMRPRRRVLGKEERVRFMQIAERSRHASLLDAFVNYQLPNGRGEEYLNRIGALMFTKYLKRIQKVITSSGVKHPIRTAAALAGASMMLDLEMIQDQALLVKAFDESDSGLLGIVPLYSPADIILSVATPGLIKLIPGV
jgi:hypothetical protein